MILSYCGANSTECFGMHGKPTCQLTLEDTSVDVDSRRQTIIKLFKIS